jgi:hypothetical protein
MDMDEMGGLFHVSELMPDFQQDVFHHVIDLESNMKFAMSALSRTINGADPTEGAEKLFPNMGPSNPTVRDAIGALGTGGEVYREPATPEASDYQNMAYWSEMDSEPAQAAVAESPQPTIQRDDIPAAAHSTAERPDEVETARQSINELYAQHPSQVIPMMNLPKDVTDEQGLSNGA